MLSSKLKSLTPSMTIGISSKVGDMKKNGIEVINLSIGEPDFNVPEKAKEYGIKSLNENCTKYNKASGMVVLREEICKKLKNENKCNYTPDEIVVSSGAKNCLTNTLLALTNPNDEIIVPKPYWVSYPEIIKLLDATPVYIDTKKDNGFKVTKSELMNSITPKTKAIIINNPSNPTGSVYSREELEDIVDVCTKNNIYIIADEIYERICYLDEFTSIASLSEKAKDITITINGFSKSFAMTGLRVGYTATNKELAKSISSIQGHLVSHPSMTSQYIAYGALKECDEDLKYMSDTYKKRRNTVSKKLDNIKDISYIKPNGAFYVFIDLSKIAKKFNYKDSFSIEFCNKLLDEFKVAVVPGIAFGSDNFIRISYACEEKLFLEGIDKLAKFISTIM